MPAETPWYKAQFQAARLYMEVTNNPDGRRAVGRLHPRVLDAIERHTESTAKEYPHGEAGHLIAKIIRLLGDANVPSSSELQTELRLAYDRAEFLALPSAVAYRQLCHRLSGVTNSFHLQSMNLEQMEALDELSDADKNAAELRKDLLFKFNTAAQATDLEISRKLAQVFEAFSELWVYRRLSPFIAISKVMEGAKPTPDFHCSLNGRDFFIEVRAPDIVGGDTHHTELMKDAMAVEIDLDRQVRSGRKISSAVSSVAPFQKIGDKNYDSRDLTYVISTIRERARTLYKQPQFSSGPTFALMFADRYPIPSNRRAILSDYKVGGMWTDCVPDDRQSGVLWQAAFGAPGTEIHNLNFPKRTLAGTPFMRDSGSAFPGIGFMTVSTIHKGSPLGETECWGLLDRETTLPRGWKEADSLKVLDAVCDVWNDSNDKRPKWFDD